MADCSELAVLINDAALNLAARSDIIGIEGITKVLKKDLPNIGRDDVVDAIVAANRRGTTAERTALQKRIAQIKKEAFEEGGDSPGLRNVIVAFEEHLKAGTLPLTGKKAAKFATSEIKKLRAVRDELRKQIKVSTPAIRKRMELRLTNLNDILSGKVKVTPRDKQVIPNELKKLENEISIVSKKIKDKRVIKNLKEKMAELRVHLKAGTLPSPQKTTAEVATNASRARQTIKDLRQQLRSSEPARIEAVQKQIDFLNVKIATGIKLPEPRVIAQGSKELELLRFKRDRIKSEINSRIQELKPKNIFGKTGAVFDLSRALKAGTDLSAPGRQGAFIGLGNPKRVIKAQKEMFQALFSEQNAQAIQKNILEGRPNSVNYLRHNLVLHPLTGVKLSKAEEEIFSDLLGRIERSGIPGQVITAPTRRSAAAFVVYLNKLRADTFDAMALSLAKKGTPTTGEMNGIANFINVATGAGNLRSLEKHAGILSKIFFAPKYVASRFQLLFGTPIFKKDIGRARQLIIKEYAKTLTGAATVFSMISVAGVAYQLTDKDLSIEIDTRSSDIGKIKIGNTRIDLLFGIAQTMTITSRFVPGVIGRIPHIEKVPLIGKFLADPKTKSLRTGRLNSINDIGFGRTGLGGIAIRFLRTKFAPLVQFPADVFVFGENVVGDPVTLFGEGDTVNALLELITPMALGDIVDAMVEQGVERGAAMGVVIAFGAGGQTFDVDKKRKPRKRER